MLVQEVEEHGTDEGQGPRQEGRQAQVVIFSFLNSFLSKILGTPMPTDTSSTEPHWQQQHLWRSPSHPLDAQRRKPQEPGLGVHCLPQTGVGPPQKSRSRKNFLYNLIFFFFLQCLIRGRAVEEMPRNFLRKKRI